MSVIWKFHIPVSDKPTTLSLPRGIFRFAAMQGESPMAWFECMAECEDSDRHFQWCGTGHEIPMGGVYLASMIDGPFVWHLYEVKK